MPKLRSQDLPFTLPLVTLLLSVAAWLVLPTDILLAWLEEGALVEDATVFLYAAAAAMVAWAAARNRIPSAVVLPLAVVLLACAARESDWHTRFTGTSMLRVSYYLRPAPLLHKIGALAAVLSVLGCAAYLVARLVRQWRAPDPPAAVVRVWTLTFVGLMVFCKVVDRSLPLLAEFTGLAGGPPWRALQLSIEEPLELVLPVLVLKGLWQYRIAHRQARSP